MEKVFEDYINSKTMWGEGDNKVIVKHVTAPTVKGDSDEPKLIYKVKFKETDDRDISRGKESIIDVEYLDIKPFVKKKYGDSTAKRLMSPQEFN